MISRSRPSETLADDRDFPEVPNDDREPPDQVQPHIAAAPIDPVEAALAAGIEAIAASMPRVAPSEIANLADRMAALARELEARRVARANGDPGDPRAAEVFDLATERRSRRS